MFRLHGKSTQKLSRFFVRAQIRKDIFRAFHRKSGIPVFFLDFLIDRVIRTIIRHSCRFDNNILLLCGLLYGCCHIRGRYNRNDLYKRRRSDCHRSRDQRHFRATAHAVFRNCIAHFSGRVIRNITHRINLLLCRSCCDHHFLSNHVLFAGKIFHNIRKQCFRLRHLSGSGIPAGKITTRRINDMKPIMLQLFDVILYDRIFKHIGIHGRGNILRAFCRQNRSCQHIICDSVCHLADHIGRSRCYHKNIRPFCQCHMLDIELEIPVKRIDQTLVACERLKRDRINKIGCIFRHDHMHIRMLLDERTCQIGDFIGSDTSGHTEYHTFSF